MTPITFMIVAGEPSGDQLAAELVAALRRVSRNRSIRFIGAGGEKMAAAGVELMVDLTRYSVIGIPSLREVRRFQALRDSLVALARRETPDVFIGVDFFGFNGSLARHIRDAVSQGPFQNWNPKLVQYVSPQVWASRPGRAQRIASTHDLLLSILPFEKEWYTKRTPALRVEFVGHPLVDRHQPASVNATSVDSLSTGSPKLLLLPGSRMGEIVRHVPVMVETARRLHASHGVQSCMVLPSESLASVVRPMLGTAVPILVQLRGLSAALREATAALACTGTVTLECAWFGVPTVTLYKTSWITYTIGKRIVTVPYLSMPNLLAGGAVMPEFVQDAATPEALSAALVPFLIDPAARSRAKEQLAQVRNQLGTPGASHRAAAAILSLIPTPSGR